MVKAQSSPRPATAETALHMLDGPTGIGNRAPHAKEQVEIQMYLSKLKQLVPDMPKNRKVSKLEVIQHVIDYICDLQTALEQKHPRRRRSLSADVSSSAAMGASAVVAVANRQPLSLLTSIANTAEPADRANTSADVTVPSC